MTVLASPLAKKVVLQVATLCETRGGHLAHVLGRVMFARNRPMLVEHVGGLYLQHDVFGKVLTPGYGDDFDIVHLIRDGA